MNNISTETFSCFKVYHLLESDSFVYCDITNTDLFIDGLVSYIFDEDNLLNYAKNTNRITFKKDTKSYVKLYKNISIFLNAELEVLEVDEVTNEIKNILGEEYKLIDQDGVLKVQNDKVGKIGEYTFHLLLTNYYNLNCILPKFRCTTDRNMSVFGIDALFLDAKNRIIYFGESKFSKNIDNGIKLINKSLADYEQQIKEEYRIVLGDDIAFNLSDEFKKIFGSSSEICITFEKFIEVARIKKIGIPIFIAHGDEKEQVNVEEYLTKMNNKIKKHSFFNLEVEYIFISLPVINKNKFIECAIKKAVEKQNEYGKLSGNS